MYCRVIFPCLLYPIKSSCVSPPVFALLADDGILVFYSTTMTVSEARTSFFPATPLLLAGFRYTSCFHDILKA
jgi:hypothetical protein